MAESPLSRLSGLWKQKNMPVLIALFVLGLCLLLFSGMQEADGESGEAQEFDEEAYRISLETRASELLQNVQGAGEVHVMITLDSLFVTNYAYDTNAEERVAAENTETSESRNLVLENGKNGSKTPVKTSVTLPRVRGVSVVASGAKSPDVQKKILDLLSALFDLKSNQISVTN